MSEAEIIEHLTEIIHIETDIIVEMYELLSQYTTIEEIENNYKLKKAMELRSEIGMQ